MIMNMIRFFWYRHPETKEMHSDQRMVGYETKPLLKGGVECELVPDYEPPVIDRENDFNLAIINKNREVFQADPSYVKKCRPKYVKFQDGHRERYDPTKHC
jgi:hypothetical protein